MTVGARELARRLDVHYGTPWHWIQQGKLIQGVHFVMVAGTPVFIWPAIYERFRPR